MLTTPNRLTVIFSSVLGELYTTAASSTPAVDVDVDIVKKRQISSIQLAKQQWKLQAYLTLRFGVR